MEINSSCPNSKEVIAENIQMVSRCVTKVKKRYPNVVIIVKTSIVHSYRFYTMLEDAGADCIHAVNTILYEMVFDSISPLEHVGGGGVSGGPAFPEVFPYIIEIPKYTSLPLIFGCGVVNEHNMEMCFEIGKQFARQVSVSMCTLPARNSKKSAEIDFKVWKRKAD